MKTKHSFFQIEYTYLLHEPYQKEDILFFDIETTGFSPKTSYVYLIGCMYYKEGSWQVTQWLNTEPQKESELILAFSEFLKKYRRIIHYNGSGFDIPFLQKKAAMYGIPDPFSHIESLDLYKLILPLKKFLSLESTRLKAIESCLGLERKDTYSGEELISVYSGYLGRLAYEKLVDKSVSVNVNSNPSAGDLEDILLLHNFEDVKSLLPISGMLYYRDILGDVYLTGNLSTVSCEFSEEESLVLLTCQLPFSFPAGFTVYCPLKERISLKGGNETIKDMQVTAVFDDNTLLFKLPVYKGTLKYYLTPPSDYYYLPLEDMAVHKSVAQYVDKEYRKKATPSTCYIKKDSLFIPRGESSFEPCFRKNYADRITYIETDKLKGMQPNELAAFGDGLLLFFKNFYHL
ncbi:ribonuclease H-like domain-containing protein [Anaerocolumna xylanovorans]|uniref:YprB ribonuclease H-like domain-containing protein n=1 Tax=Anaerocolumna xylanovorans DSM 12503 TaxID=1121345 RepID=A0A1M7YCH9_9FIRM|nr:ribonuclease H-like domain-containing protein [Anaerocolumna xylanovorans]SHO50301.1 hypothetical protein SAMN02745217_02688 [Anaerocolumna xylanovorans DSM 12503]